MILERRSGHSHLKAYRRALIRLVLIRWFQVEAQVDFDSHVKQSWDREHDVGILADRAWRGADVASLLTIDHNFLVIEHIDLQLTWLRWIFEPLEIEGLLELF